MKDKNHMIISLDVEKVFDKIPHLFVIKTLNKISIGGTELNKIRFYIKNPQLPFSMMKN